MRVCVFRQSASTLRSLAEFLGCSRPLQFPAHISFFPPLLSRVWFIPWLTFQIQKYKKVRFRLTCNIRQLWDDYRTQLRFS